MCIVPKNKAFSFIVKTNNKKAPKFCINNANSVQCHDILRIDIIVDVELCNEMYNFAAKFGYEHTFIVISPMKPPHVSISCIDITKRTKWCSCKCYPTHNEQHNIIITSYWFHSDVKGTSIGHSYWNTVYGIDSSVPGMVLLQWIISNNPTNHTYN